MNIKREKSMEYDDLKEVSQRKFYPRKAITLKSYPRSAKAIEKYLKLYEEYAAIHGRYSNGGYNRLSDKDNDILWKECYESIKREKYFRKKKMNKRKKIFHEECYGSINIE